MAKKIVWSPLAQKRRKEILNYWIKNNKSESYSFALNQLFKEAVKLLSLYPEIGRPSDIESVRIKIVRNYQIFYQASDKEIHILTIWDSHQNPDNLKLS